MVIPFSLTCKTHVLRKYASASSLPQSSKFLILQFLVKCCKLHSVSKILSKSHMLDILLISSVYYKCSYKLSFHSLKSLNSPNLYINWANMSYPDYQNKKNSVCACSVVSRVFIYASINPICGTLIINLAGKNLICTSYCKQIKTFFARIK